MSIESPLNERLTSLKTRLETFTESAPKPLLIGLIALFTLLVMSYLLLSLVGYSDAVDEAREALLDQRPRAAIQTLSGLESDAPELHLARAQAHLAREEFPLAAASLDQVFRLLVTAENRESSWLEAQLGLGRETLRQEAPRGASLQQRLDFLQGLLALLRGEKAEGDAARVAWASAQASFQRVLQRDPSDEDARWNYEYAWYKAHPACPLREDNHEPDNDRDQLKPFDPEQASDRLLCPGDEDWYGFQLPAGAAFSLSLKGEPGPEARPRQKRALKVTLFAPDGGEEVANAEWDGRSARLRFDPVPNAGLWGLQVAGEGDAEILYSLEPAVDLPCPVGEDELEPNDEQAQAKPLAATQGKPLKACVGNPDWYLVEVPSTESLILELKFDRARAELDGELFNSEGQRVAALDESAAGRSYRFETEESAEEAATPSASSPTPPARSTQDAASTAPKASAPAPLTSGALNVPPLLARPPSATSSGSRPTIQGQSPESEETEEETPPRRFFLLVQARAKENRYELSLAPPSEGDDQDQQDQDQDKEQDQQEQEQDQDQQEQEQDQQEQEQEQDQQEQEQEQEQQLNLQQLIESLEEQERNPQLEKAIRMRPNLPQMEDY